MSKTIVFLYTVFLIFTGGGSFDDSDLVDVSGGDYKPDRTGGGKGKTLFILVCPLYQLLDQASPHTVFILQGLLQHIY